MNELELIKPQISEADLELIVREKTLGSLVTNARQIKEAVERALPNYDIANYNEGNIDTAKKDKAMLNGAAKTLNAKRLEIEREFTKPFDEFKGIVNDTVKLISECSAKIDVVVKQSEQKYKDEKKARIEAYFTGKGFTLVPFSKLFDEKYLNKTFKEKDACLDIDMKIERIQDDLVTLESIGEDAELLTSIYLDSLNINNAIQYAKRLKENRERAQKEAEARAKSEAERHQREAEAHAKAEIARQERERELAAERAKMAEIHAMQAIVSAAEKQAKNDPESAIEDVPVENVTPELLTRAFRVTTTRENIIALGDFMNERGIEFEKIEL